MPNLEVSKTSGVTLPVIRLFSFRGYQFYSQMTHEPF